MCDYFREKLKVETNVGNIFSNVKSFLPISHDLRTIYHILLCKIGHAMCIVFGWFPDFDQFIYEGHKNL